MGKRISQLNALSSASLNTTLVGIDNGVTYKITLDVLEDAVIHMLSASTDARLDFLETFSSSFNSFSASLDSRLDNVVIDTSSLATKTSLNTFTQSYQTDSASFDSRIASHITGTNYISESYNEFVTSYHAESSSFSSRIEAATNEQFIAGLLLTASYNVDSTSFDNRIDSLESFSSSADNRYVLSGSITQTTWDNIANKPNNIVSSSTQIATLGFVTGSYTTINEFNSLTQSFNIISGSVVSIQTGFDTASYQLFTQSIDSRVDSLEAATASYLTSLSGSGIVSGAAQITAMGYAKLVGGNTFYSEQTFTNKVNFQNTLSASVIDNLNSYTASLKNAINVSGIGTSSVTTIYGNLHIEGLTTTTSASNLAVANNFIYLNDSSSITNPDLGIAGNYNDGTYAHSGIFSDASDGHKWKVFKGYQPEPSQSIDTNDASFQLADFVANNIYGDLHGNVYATNGILSSSLGFVSTASYNSFTASYNTGSFTGSFKGSISGTLAGTVSNANYSAYVLTQNSNTNQDYSLIFVPSGSNGYLQTYSDGVPGVLYNPSTNRLKSQYISGAIEATNGVISGSSQISALGFISTSTDLSSLNTISASYLTFTQSYYSDSSSFSIRIEAATNEQYIAGFATTSSVTTISASAWGAFTSASSYSASAASWDNIHDAKISDLNIISASYLTFTQSYYTNSSSVATSISASNYNITINSASVSSLSSSFNSRINNITASVNINTGSFVTTSSFNAFTASAQMVTTGSNAFNGTQTITGSLIITSGSFIGSQIVANTSSLYLTSGSNMYVQNNGVVEITGSLIVNGTTRFATVGGDEGGEIEFGVPQTNTTLSTSVKADIYQNRFRIFDGNTNGVYVDLSKAPTGVNGELTWKASGMVNAGTFVQLDNIKATVTSSGQRGLSLATLSGSYTYSIGGTYGAGVGTGGASTTGTLTTTPTASIFGWGFTATGDISTYVLTDTTNNRCYRITLQIGGSFNNNSIVIERLH